MNELKVKIKSIGGVLPEYKTSGSAGMDIHAFTDEPIVIEPGERKMIHTGICLAIPTGYEAQIRARSGHAWKNGIGLVNGVGTIDSDYRGEIKIPLINWGDEPFVINNGDRIAQMLITRFEHVSWETVYELDETERSEKGFGHTGK